MRCTFHVETIATPDIEFDSVELGNAQAGALRVHTARDEGRLVGFCTLGVAFNLHYGESYQATQRRLVWPEGDDGYADLVSFSDSQLRAEGVQVVMRSGMGDNFATVPGYQPIDRIYARAMNTENANGCSKYG